jgi:WD40 repeat protein
MPLDSTDREIRLNEIIDAYLRAVDCGQTPDRQDLLARHPDLAPELMAFFADQDRFRGPAEPLQPLGPATGAAVDALTLPPPQSSGASPLLGKAHSFGDYELLEEIARGGMGVVYKARQISLNRPVALKMILAGQLASAQDVQRFHTEAEAAANLDHPHIVPIYEVGQHEGQHYFSMKLIDCGSLAQAVALWQWAVGSEEVNQRAAQLVATVARAVHYAHQRGILHRDLKPANILLSFSREPRASAELALARGSRLNECTPHVTDFGLAKRVEGGTSLTQPGAIVGTPSYMAPEQARAEKGLSTAVDVYSLGAILYELLTGRPPFRGPTDLDIILQVLDREPLPPRKVDPRVDQSLETVCLKCLEKAPANRYGSAEALADDLDRFLRGEPIRTRAAGLREQVVKWVKRRPVVAGLLAALVLLAVVSGVLVTWSYGEALQQAKNAHDERDAARTAENHTQEALARTQRALTTSKVAQALVALRDNDPKLGLSLLEDCLPKTRFWEWYYARRLCRGAPLTLHDQSAFSTAVFSPDGRWIATTGVGGLVLFDARLGAERWRRPDCFWAPAAFSPDSSRVAAWRNRFNPVGGVAEVELRVWEVGAGKELLTIPAKQNGSGGPIVFGADGQWLACAGINHTTAVWDLRDPKHPKQQFAVPLKNANLFYNWGYAGQVQLAYTPGGWLAVHDGEEVHFLDPRTGKVLRTIRAPGSGSEFSPEARYLALMTDRGSIRVLDLATPNATTRWEVSMEFLGGGRCILKFSPDGEHLAFLYNSYPVRIFEATTGKLLGTLPNQSRHSPGNLSFSGDGQRLAVCNEDAVEIWNARDFDIWKVRDMTGGLTLRGHTDTILALAFSPAGRRLLTIANTWKTFRGPPWEIKGWDVDGGFARTTLPGRGARLNCAAFNPKADRVAAGGSDHTVRICDTRTGRELLLIEIEGSPTSLAFGPGGALLAVLVKEGEVSRICILDAIAGRRRRVIAPRGYVAALALSPDGRSVAGAVTDSPTGAAGRTLQRVQVWSVETGKDKWPIPPAPNRVVSGVALAFSPDGSWLAGNTTDKTVTLWDAQTGIERLQFKAPSRTSLGGMFVDSISNLVFSADGERLAAGWSIGEQLIVWDTHTGQGVFSFKSDVNIHGMWIAFRADGRALAFANGPWVSLLSAETVPRRTYLEGSSPMGLFSPDGRLVAAAGPDNDILIFSARSGRQLRHLEGHTRPIASLVFSDDSKRLVSASYWDPFGNNPGNFRPGNRSPIPGELKVWNVEKGDLLARFDEVDKMVAVALSADGSRVAAQSGLNSIQEAVRDNVIQVWDVLSRRRLRVIRPAVPMGVGIGFAEAGRVIFGSRLTEAPNPQVKGFLAWSVDTGNPAKIVRDPFAKLKRDKRTEDGRRLWSSNGILFIQAEPDEREHERLESQARPDRTWQADKARAAENDKQWFAARFHLGRLLLKSPGDMALLCRRARANMGL